MDKCKMTLGQQQAAISDKVSKLIRDVENKVYDELKEKLEVRGYDPDLRFQAHQIAVDYVFDETEIGRKYARLENQIAACAGGGVVDVQTYNLCGGDMGNPIEVKIYADGSELMYDPSIVVKD